MTTTKRRLNSLQKNNKRRCLAMEESNDSSDSSDSDNTSSSESTGNKKAKAK